MRACMHAELAPFRGHDEQAMIASDELAAEDGDDVPEMRTPRRSNSAHYGCSRHALRYLLRRLGLDVQVRGSC